MRDDEMCGNTIGMRRDVPGNARKIAKAARERRAAFFVEKLHILERLTTMVYRINVLQIS